jgi:hypothetical protein
VAAIISVVAIMYGRVVRPARTAPPRRAAIMAPAGAARDCGEMQRGDAEARRMILITRDLTPCHRASVLHLPARS